MAQALVVEPGELGELLASLLAQYGIDAERARTGEEALERALANTPAIVIVDQTLPDAPGIDVAEFLRGELGCKVILTYPQQLVAEPDDALLERIRALDGSFLRPFRSLTLVELVAKLLEIPLPGVEHGTARVALSTTLSTTLSSAQSSAQSSALPSALSSSEGAAITDEGGSEALLLDEVEDAPAASVLAAPVGAPVPGVALPLDRDAPTRTFAPGALSALWQTVKTRRQSGTPPPLPMSDTPLSPRTLADALDAFHQSQTTGEIWLENGRARRVLFLRRGVITGARSNLTNEDLVGLALKQDRLTPEGVLAVRDDLKSGAHSNVLDSVLARGLLAEAALQQLVQEHTRLVALRGFSWQSGTLRVTFESRAVREPVVARVPVGDIVVRVILLTETDEALAHAAPDDARFTPAADAGYGLHDLALSAAEARVVVAMDGTKTIKDLAVLFPETPARTIRGLAAGLRCIGLVRFAGWGAAAARQISYF